MNTASRSTGRRPGEFIDRVKHRNELREKCRREGDSSFWSSVGMMGTIGWSVSIPIVLGLLFGRWLDSRLGSAQIFMIFFMILGLVSGCITAWRLVSEKM